MAQFNTPIGKPELNDGNYWFTLATENWVKNTINAVEPCTVATTANLTAIYDNGTAGVEATLTNSGTQAALVIDGVTLAVGGRVLVKDQATGFQNGVYNVINTGSISTNWILRRITSYDSPLQMIRGRTISVFSGTLSAASIWMLTSIVTTVGTSDITFAKTDQNSFTSILGTTNQIAVSVTDGVATISVAPNPVLPGTASVTIPTGTTVQRPVTPTAGMFRFNTSL